jgi:hypothetical protein
MIQRGDKVRAFLDGTFAGEVVEVIEENPRVWTVEGTQATVRYCIVKLRDGRLAKVKSSDLYVEY